MYDYVILREASFPVGSKGAYTWPILTARVTPLQNKVSTEIPSHVSTISVTETVPSHASTIFVTEIVPIRLSQDSHWQQSGTTHIHNNAIIGPTDPVVHLDGLTE